MLEKEMREYILSALHIILSELPERFHQYAHADYSKMVTIKGAEREIASYLAEVAANELYDLDDLDGSYGDDISFPINVFFSDDADDFSNIGAIFER